MTNNIVLFRFHKNPEKCLERLKLIKELNPEYNIYGLGEDIEGVEILKQITEDIHYIPNKKDRWKWKNGDLAILDWFKHHKDVEFNTVHVIEWDLILTEPLSSFPKIPEKGFALSGLTDLSRAIKQDWNTATGNRDIIEFLKSYSPPDAPSYAGLFPGASFSKEFLEEYMSLAPPEVGNDELRIGILGPKIGTGINTGFYKGWENKSPNRLFNCKNLEVQEENIIHKMGSKFAFHPYKGHITKKLKREILN